MKTCSRGSSIAARILVSSSPAARRTGGRCASSVWPGPSPTTTNRASAGAFARHRVGAALAQPALRARGHERGDVGERDRLRDRIVAEQIAGGGIERDAGWREARRPERRRAGGRPVGRLTVRPATARPPDRAAARAPVSTTGSPPSSRCCSKYSPRQSPARRSRQRLLHFVEDSFCHVALRQERQCK